MSLHRRLSPDACARTETPHRRRVINMNHAGRRMLCLSCGAVLEIFPSPTPPESHSTTPEDHHASA